MVIVDRGQGTPGVPIIVVPGIQGRWEYARQAVEALATSRRVLTFSLLDEPSAEHQNAEHRERTSAPTIDDLADQIGEVLDARGIARAVVCGISFGGRSAIRFAARQPHRVAALVVASTPGPSWHLRPSHRLYVKAPRLFVPLFALGAPWRLGREIAVAIPERRVRAAFRRQMLRLLIDRPLSPTRMAARARLMDGMSNADDCARVAAPTLVLTGEASLDHVVPTEGTSDYARLIAGADTAVLAGSGHLGSVTRPAEFARLVNAFIARRVPEANVHAA